ncbi:MAG TPA: AMIN domain-containing protein [candidate division Zixibacteria bacterium]
MKKIFYIALIYLLLCCVWSEVWAECKVNNLSLERDSTFTKVVIYADIPFEYEHLTVEAKDGKPYRIVVDIADAIHALSQNNFLYIPSQTITAIRTSQFTTEPNRKVRIVIDVRSPIVYKIEKEKENQLSLIISTPQDSNFTLWAADMSSLKGKETKLAQAPQIEEKKQKDVPKLAEKEVKSTEAKQVIQAQAKEKEEKPKATVVEKKEAKPAEKIIAPKTEEKKQVKTASKSNIVPAEKPPQAQKAKPTEEIKEEAKVEAESTTTETSQVAQLKVKAEKTAEAIKSQVEKIKPRGEVIEAVYKRKVITYGSEDQRDPFTPIGEEIKVEFGKAPQPAYESLKLVGILKDVSGNMALLEDGEGYGYIMRQGDKVRNGEVIYVGDDRVLFQIVEFGWSKTVAIELSKEK